MKRYAVLVGAANLSDCIQKSLVNFKNFLTSDAGGGWRESEIMITGPLDWQLVQLLQLRLSVYDFLLVYQCHFSRNTPNSDCSGKLRILTEGGRGVFISDVCDEIIRAKAIGLCAGGTCKTRRE